jgi:predicted amidohydrolase YtcJ
MRSPLPSLLATLLLAACAHAPLAGPFFGGADTVLKNGAVYTVDARRSWAQAVAIRGGRIAYVGDDTGAEAWIGPRTRVVDLGGRMLLPGFADSHVHMLEGGYALGLCNLTALTTRAQYLEAVQAYAAAHPAGEWVIGFGWALEAFPGGNPAKEDLDRIAPGRRVFLIANDGHSAWMSSAGFAALGIGAATPDPEDGRFERAPDGTPSGTLRDGATTRVQGRVVSPTPFGAAAGLRAGIAEANRHGITSYIEARANIAEGFDVLYAGVALTGGLDARATLSLYLDPAGDDAQVDALIRRYRPHATNGLKVDQVKIFLDGVTESQTAALLAPYAGTSATGPLAFDLAKLRRWAVRLDAAGFQLHMHALGDRAVREGLDLIAYVARANGPRDRRPHLVHLYLVDPADRPRFKALGAAANIQALWAYPSVVNETLDRPYLGEARYAQLIPLGSLVRAGALVAGGSDWPVTTVAPLAAMQVAVTRQDPQAGPGAPALSPGERTTLAAMIAATPFTGRICSGSRRRRAPSKWARPPTSSCWARTSSPCRPTPSRRPRSCSRCSPARRCTRARQAAGSGAVAGSRSSVGAPVSNRPRARRTGGCTGFQPAAGTANRGCAGFQPAAGTANRPAGT